MTKRGPNWWDALSHEQLEELNAMCRDRSLTYTEVGSIHGKTASDIGYYATTRLGLPPRSKRKNAAPRKSAKRESALEATERALQEAILREEQLRNEISNLRHRRAELALRFEDDEDCVIVYGIGPKPVRASAADWLQWLRLEGPKKLREHISARTGANISK